MKSNIEICEERIRTYKKLLKAEQNSHERKYLGGFLWSLTWALNISNEEYIAEAQRYQNWMDEKGGRGNFPDIFQGNSVKNVEAVRSRFKEITQIFKENIDGLLEESKEEQNGLNAGHKGSIEGLNWVLGVEDPTTQTTSLSNLNEPPSITGRSVGLNGTRRGIVPDIGCGLLGLLGAIIGILVGFAATDGDARAGIIALFGVIVKSGV